MVNGLDEAQIVWKAAEDKMKAAQKALDDWNATTTVEVETAIASTAPTTHIAVVETVLTMAY